MVTDPEADWAERWRAFRGSPSDLPNPEAFNLLRSLPAEAVREAAEATGDDAEQVRWWKEIAADEKRQHLAPIKMSLVPIFRALRDSGPMTDDELTGHLQKSKSSVGPRRVELQREGLIREVGKSLTSAGRKATVWGLVPAEDIELAREEAAAKGPRRKHVDTYTTEQQADIVRYLIRKDEVNAVLQADRNRSKATDRARSQARSLQVERDRARREYNDRIRQAEREASPQLLFLKALGGLRRAGDAAREIEKVIQENIENQLLFGNADIAVDHWPEVRHEIQELIKIATSADEQLTRLLDGDEIVDLEFWDAEVLEVEAGQDDDV